MGTVRRRSLRIKQEKNLKSLVSARQTMIMINSNIDPNKTEPIDDVSEFMPYDHVWKLFTSDLTISPQAAKEFTACIRYFSQPFQTGFEDEIKYIPLIPDM